MESEDHRVMVEELPSYLDPATRAFLSEILDRLALLEETNKQKDEKITALKSEIRKLKEEMATFREEVALERAHDRKRIADLEDLVEREGLEAARARQRITALETPPPALREETAKEHIDCLFSEMRRLRIKQTTAKDAARIIGVSKPLMTKIKPYLADDSRFVILRDPQHKQRHLIRLAEM